MAKLIPFSGASNSGKTTTIERIISQYSGIIYLDEVIRRKTTINIDDIRSNPKEYLDFQYEVIGKKIDEENHAFEKYIHTNDIILIDRSVIDSLFYYIFYMDKSGFEDLELERYVSLFNRITEHISKNIYYKVILFKPILKIDLDFGVRTKNLKYFQNIEYFIIKKLTYSCFKSNQIEEVDLEGIENLVANIQSI